MSYTLTLDCYCGAEIPGVEQFDREPLCCLACHRTLILTHECGNGCYDYAEAFDWPRWIGLGVWREQLAALVRTNGVLHPKYIDYPLIARQLWASTREPGKIWALDRVQDSEGGCGTVLRHDRESELGYILEVLWDGPGPWDFSTGPYCCYEHPDDVALLST